MREPGIPQEAVVVTELIYRVEDEELRFMLGMAVAALLGHLGKNHLNPIPAT